eukprot:gene6717-8326_t
MAMMTAREHPGIPIALDSQKQFKPQMTKKNKKQQFSGDWEDLYLMSLKRMFKDNLNEYPQKQLERPNRDDLSEKMDKDLDDWKCNHDQVLEKELSNKKELGRRTHPEFQHPRKRKIRQVKPQQQLRLHPLPSPLPEGHEAMVMEYEDMYMLPLRDFFHTPYDLTSLERTKQQDQLEYLEMNQLEKKIHSEEHQPERIYKMEKMKAKSDRKERQRLEKERKIQRKLLKQRGGQQFRHPIHPKQRGLRRIDKRGLQQQRTTTTTDSFQQTTTTISDGEFRSLPIREVVDQQGKVIGRPPNDPKQKPMEYEVDFTSVQTETWRFDNGRVYKV